MQKNERREDTKYIRRASKIQKSLLEQLKMKRADTPYYNDIVEQYIAMWWRVQDEPDARSLVALNNQMLRLLKELGLSVEKIGVTDDDDEL